MRLSTRAQHSSNPWACSTESCRCPSTRVWWDKDVDILWPYCDRCGNHLAKYFYDQSMTIEEAKLLLVKEAL